MDNDSRACYGFTNPSNAAAGDSEFIELLTVQRTLFTTRLSVLDAYGQAKQALAEIEGLLVTLQP